MNSNHKLPVTENLLNQDFNIDKPDTVRVGEVIVDNRYCAKETVLSLSSSLPSQLYTFHLSSDINQYFTLL